MTGQDDRRRTFLGGVVVGVVAMLAAGAIDALIRGWWS